MNQVFLYQPIGIQVVMIIGGDPVSQMIGADAKTVLILRKAETTDSA